MNSRNFLFLLAVTIIVTASGEVHSQTTPPKIEAKLTISGDRVEPGRTINASLTIDIPPGYHVNAHEPVSTFALATKIQVKAPEGVRVGAITYPKAIIRKFSFSDDRLGVYENRTVIRIRLFVPANQPRRRGQITAVLNYQSCSNEVCFPPMKREISTPFSVS